MFEKTEKLVFGCVLSLLLVSCTATTVEKPRSQPLSLAAHTIILVGDDTPAYTRVADAIVRKIHHKVPVYNLYGNPALGKTVGKEIRSSRRRLVVAIGLPAALVARQFSGKRVIFCQVFNYQSAALIKPAMKGVAAIPSPEKQFRAWKRLSPKLSRIGVITGKGLDDLIAEARAGAEANNLKLVHMPVSSDKEMLFAYKRLGRGIQGLWLIPDNRVLSARVIRELMSDSVRRGKQVLVFKRELLKLGGLMSTESDAHEIADLVVARLRGAAAHHEIPGPGIVYPTRVQLQVNPIIMKRFGLSLPRGLGATRYVR